MHALYAEKYEGTTRIPEERADFNYDYLVSGIKELNEKIEKRLVTHRNFKSKEEKILIFIKRILDKKYLI